MSNLINMKNRNIHSSISDFVTEELDFGLLKKQHINSVIDHGSDVTFKTQNYEFKVPKNNIIQTKKEDTNPKIISDHSFSFTF